ncbi:MAG: FkbM family methyltransferase [Chitinophagaceae bacterium]|nr:FkbM family methyltransferase [Chitinophagaceae bacterium]
MFNELRKRGRKIVDSFYCKNTGYKKEFGKKCTWFIDTKGLNKESIVYSGGVGNDITFELEIANAFECSIYLFDPSETGISTMRKEENRHPLIQFFPIGLSEQNGIKKFSLPETISEGSYRICVTSEEIGEKNIYFECKSVPSLVQEFNHREIDLLKIDIEGFEYEVLESILKSDIIVRQICVEFHHFFSFIPKKKTDRILKLLKQHSYRIIHKRMLDYTFLLNEK